MLQSKNAAHRNDAFKETKMLRCAVRTAFCRSDVFHVDVTAF